MPMKANKTEPQSQTRKQKKDTPWILHIFNHICFVTTIIGCYSCHWKIKQEKKFKHGQCCSLVQRDGKKLNYIFLIWGTWAGSYPHTGSLKSSGLGRGSSSSVKGLPQFWGHS